MTQAPALVAPANGLGGQARALLGLAVPLIGSNVAGFAIHVTDTVLMGWYDVTGLAGMVLAGSLWIIVLLMGSGFGAAVMPLAAKAAQEGDLREVRRVTRMGLWLSLGFAAVALPLLLASGRLFAAMGQEPEVARQAGLYLRITGWALVPALVTMVLRSFLSALERTAVLLWATLGAALLNAVWGYALIFGVWGFPEMGIEGAAWAALATHALSALMLLAYILLRLPEYELLRRFWRPDLGAMGRVFRLGWPIGGQLLAEVGLFAGSSVMVGWLGEVPLAAHGVTMQLVSATFMVHLGLSQAVTVRTGRALGRHDREGMRQGALAAILLSVGFALVTTAAFLLMPRALLSLFLDPGDPASPAVIAVGTTLLAIASLSQLFDGAQVLALGLLRGLQDTTVPMILAALSYWCVGLPLAYVLGFVAEWEQVGIWVGLVVSLVCVSALLMARFWRRAAQLGAPA